MPRAGARARTLAELGGWPRALSGNPRKANRENEAAWKQAQQLPYEEAVVLVLGRSVEKIGETTRREHPDVALVALGESSEHALLLLALSKLGIYCTIWGFRKAAPILRHDPDHRGEAMPASAAG